MCLFSIFLIFIFMPCCAVSEKNKEAQAKIHREAEAKTKSSADEKVHLEKARQEAEEKAHQEAEEKARQEAEEKDEAQSAMAIPEATGDDFSNPAVVAQNEEAKPVDVSERAQNNEDTLGTEDGAGDDGEGEVSAEPDQNEGLSLTYT